MIQGLWKPVAGVWQAEAQPGQFNRSCLKILKNYKRARDVGQCKGPGLIPQDCKNK